MGRFALVVMPLVACMTAADLLAQSQPPSQMPQTASTAQKSAEGERVFTGCLRQTRADTSTANPEGEIYTLEVTPEPMPTSPRPEGSSPPATKMRYALSFKQPTDLSKHVDHQVQVTGRLIADAKAAAAATASKPAKPLPGDAQQMLHVSAFKHVAPKCP
jgi:hypothetical protein